MCRWWRRLSIDECRLTVRVIQPQQGSQGSMAAVGRVRALMPVPVAAETVMQIAGLSSAIRLR